MDADEAMDAIWAEVRGGDAVFDYKEAVSAIREAFAVRDRARAELRRLKRTAPMGGAVGLADDAMRAMLKRIIDGEE